MSLCDVLPIGGVSRELSAEVMSNIESTPIYSNSDEEGRAAIRSAALETHSIMSASNELDENDGVPVRISSESVCIDSDSIAENLAACDMEVDFVRNFKERKRRAQTVQTSLFSVVKVRDSVDDYNDAIHLNINFSENLSTAPGCQDVDGNYDKIREFIEKNNKLPSTISKNQDEKKIGKAWSRYKTGTCKHLHTDFVNEITNKYPELFVDTVQQNYQLIREFIEKNNKLPSHSSKNQDEKKIGIAWSSYKTGTYKHLHTDFVNEITNKYPELFIDTTQQNYQLIREFIEKNNKLPSSMGKNQDEKKIGNAWSKYKTGICKHLHTDFVNEITSKLGK
jgi:ribosomal protein S17E